jgi:transglutaminase-like putative cysteine protease
MRYRITHTTTYDYARPVATCHNEARLVPRRTATQRPIRTQFLVDPTPATLAHESDYFGNTVAFLTIEEPHARLTITAMSDVAVGTPAAIDPAATPPWDLLREGLRHDRTADGLAAYELVFESPHVRIDDRLHTYAAPSFAAGRPILAAALDLAARMHADFAYDPTVTTVGTPVAECLASRRGVCQDFAHLALACLRAHGVAARYVSGYLETSPAPGSARLIGSDASHAWIGVWCGDAGWVDIDPTNNQLAGTRHITVAWGRDYADVAPVKGVILGGGAHTVAVSVDVAAMGE